MYAVTFFKNRQPYATYNWRTESNAIHSLESNAAYHSLSVSENQWYASSGGTIPEMEIRIEYWEE